MDKFEQRKRLFYGSSLMKDLVGRDSPGIGLYDIDKVTGTIGNQRVIDKRRSKAFGFSKSVRMCVFETNNHSRKISNQDIL